MRLTTDAQSREFARTWARRHRRKTDAERSKNRCDKCGFPLRYGEQTLAGRNCNCECKENEA